MSDESLQEICCCIGAPVAGNPTQYMIEAAFRRAGLHDWRFLTFQVAPEDLASAIAGFRVFGFRGGNIIFPHEQSVVAYLDELTEPARLCGAVNCVTRIGDKLVGDNSDGRGFVQTLRGVTDPTGKRITLLGAGGAARAIAVELALNGAGAITVVNRTKEHGQALVDLLLANTSVEATLADWDGKYEVAPDADVLIQATSIGLNDPDAMPPIAVESIRSELIVADVIFNPTQTRLLQVATRCGCTTCDGLEMLVNQGIIDFKNWTGVEPDAEAMRESAEEFLSV